MKKGSFDQYLEEKLKENKSLQSELEGISRAIDISFQIFDLRQSRGLTQAQLAVIAQTSQSDIARLENSDYTGYSLKTLEKIAAALDAEVNVDLVPKDKSQKVNDLTRSYMILWDELAGRSNGLNVIAALHNHPANPPIYSVGTSMRSINNTESEFHFSYA